MPTVIEAAVYFSCGAAALYLLGDGFKRRANYFSSITRVTKLNCLDDILKGKTTNLLVVVSGRVGSEAPLICKHKGLLSVFVEEKAKVDYEFKLENGRFIKNSLNYLLQQTETPWYLEDSTGQVNVVGAQTAAGFYATLNQYTLKTSASELFNKLVIPEGFKVLGYSCHERALNIGASLTFVGEAVRDKAGNLMIQRPKDQSFLVFRGEGSFEKMVSDIESDAETLILYSKIFGAIVVAMGIMYGVYFVRKVLLSFEWKKRYSRKGSQNTISDNTEAQSMKEEGEEEEGKEKIE